MKQLNRIPGGIILVPLILGMLLNTFIPALLDIGGPSTALFKTGNNTLMGLFLIICGSQINFKEVGVPLYKGAVMLVLKVAIGGLIAFAVSWFFGAKGVLGLTPFVLFCALPSNNSSLYLALSSEYGDANDTGAVSVLALKNGPFASMLLMGAFGAASIPFTDIIAIVIPIIVGAVWGNFDENFRNLCKSSQNMVILAMSFGIGASSTLGKLLNAGLSGIILGFFVLLMGVMFFFVYNVLLKKEWKTPMGAAMGTVANNSALTPAIIAATDPRFNPLVATASAQCATACIITMLGAPIMVSYFDRWMKKRGMETSRTVADKKAGILSDATVPI